MRKVLIIAIILIFVSGNLFAGDRKWVNTNFKRLKLKYSTILKSYPKKFLYELASKDLYIQQNLDFLTRASILDGLLESIETSLDEMLSSTKSRLDEGWIKYLIDSNVIEGALFYNRSGELYVIGNVKTNIKKDFSQKDRFHYEGFHIVDNSLYYYFAGSNIGVYGKVLVDNKYLVDNLLLNIKNLESQLLTGVEIIEISKNADAAKHHKVSSLIIYSVPKSKETEAENSKRIMPGTVNKRMYKKLLNRKLIIDLKGITYIKKIYSTDKLDLVFLASYKNKITSNYVYSITLLISLLMAIFLLVLLIVSAFARRKGGKLTMENIEDVRKREAQDKERRDKIKTEGAQGIEGNPIDEIDSEVSKIILEEKVTEEVGEKPVGELSQMEKTEPIIKKDEEKGKEGIDEKIEELKKDGIIIE